MKNLERLNITPILTRAVPVQPSVAYHPDMQFFHLGGNKAVCAPAVFDYYNSILTPLGFDVICGQAALSGNYPSDIAYNIARVGGLALHKTAYTDVEILKHLDAFRIRIIDVSQGYTKCALAVLSENAVITSDHGLAEALRKTEVDVLEITSGGIALPGMDYGFIGGACGLIAKNLLAFCGNIEQHPDYPKIKAFADAHSVDIISLCEGGLIDIGSIIPIKQEVMDWSNSQ